MKSYFWFLLTIAVIAKVKGSFSMYKFVDDLVACGYYDFFIEVNNELGNDVAIEFCETITQSCNCEILVRVFLPPPRPPYQPCPPPPGMEVIDPSPPYVPSLFEIILKNLDILEANMTPEEVDYILDRYSE